MRALDVPKDIEPSAWHVLREGGATQARVLGALVLREMQVKHGRHNVGYLWAVVEAVMYIGVFMLLFLYRGRTQHGGMDLLPFLLTGILPFLTMRKIAGNISAAESYSQALVVYRQITVLDVMLARFLLDSATFFVIFALVSFCAWMAGMEAVPHDLLGTIAALSLCLVLGFGIGLIQNVCMIFVPVINHILGHVWRFMFFVSCVFYTLRDMPAGLQRLFLYNPVVHLIERLRASYFENFQTPVEGYGYALTIIALLLSVGLLSERMMRYRKFL